MSKTPFMPSDLQAPRLPDGHTGIRVDKLTQTFAKTTTSFKYLWFLAIVNEFKTMPDHNGKFHSITFAELLKSIFERAHLYTHYYKLHFGATDQLADILTELVSQSGETIGTKTANFDHKRYRDFWERLQLNEKSKEFKGVVRYVPRRLLTPFVSRDLVGLNDGLKNPAIDEEFGQGWQAMDEPPPYFYRYEKPHSHERSRVEVPWQWCRYFHDYHNILESWMLWHLSIFLARNNRNVPGIELKLMPPQKRESMSKHRLLWKLVLQEWPDALYCPYSNRQISKIDALDHYIPYSFIYHNQPWNLVPTISSINSSKSDRLPQLNKSMPGFLNMQEYAIKTLAANRSQKFHELVFSYEHDVFGGDNLEKILQNEKAMRQKLKKLITANHSAAQNQGYALWRQAELI